MKKLLIVLAFVTAAALSFAAVNDSAGIIFPILDMGTGARAAGMGGAYTAVADDASAVYWNAAGLGGVRTIQAVLTYNQWFLDTVSGRAMFTFPLSAGTIGADVTYMNLGEFTDRDEFGNEILVEHPFMAGGSIGYGITFGDISGGVALKIMNQTIGDYSDTVFAGDAGAIYRNGTISAGLSLQNIGYGIGYELPLNIKAGVAVKFIDSPQHSLLTVYDAQYLFNDELFVNTGAEYVYAGILAARLGYRMAFAHNNLDGFKSLSGGIGVYVSTLKLDYAVIPYGDLGITHMVTVTYGFGGMEERERAK